MTAEFHIYKLTTVVTERSQPKIKKWNILSESFNKILFRIKLDLNLALN